MQGLPLLVGLVEEGGAHDDGALTAIAVPCLWRLLQAPPAALPHPQLCRVLASLGLCHRLVKALHGLHSALQAASAVSCMSGQQRLPFLWLRCLMTVCLLH